MQQPDSPLAISPKVYYTEIQISDAGVYHGGKPYGAGSRSWRHSGCGQSGYSGFGPDGQRRGARVDDPDRAGQGDSGGAVRSEEHTSELQSLIRISYAVFCLNKQ